MTRPHRWYAGMVAVLAGLALLAAPAHAAGDPMAGAPATGDCYRLTLDDGSLYSIDDEAVSCSGKHTTTVVAVGELPDRLTWDSSDKEIGAVVSKTCDPAFNGAVHGDAVTRFQTRYSWFWFAPSRSQRDAGARWFSCHVAVLQDDALAPLAEPLERVDRHPSDAIARCTSGLKTFYATTCADRHDWRMTHAQMVRGVRSTDAKILATARKVCPRQVSTSRWLYSWDVLGAHQFILGCSEKTRR